MTMTTKKRALGIAEGLKTLANDAIAVYCQDGAVLVSLGEYGELSDEDAGSMRSMGWFKDAFTGQWCFCV